MVRGGPAETVGAAPHTLPSSASDLGQEGELHTELQRCYTQRLITPLFAKVRECVRILSCSYAASCATNICGCVRTCTRLRVSCATHRERERGRRGGESGREVRGGVGGERSSGASLC